MAHSLGDGIRSFNQSIDQERARALDWLETMGWRDPAVRGRIMDAVPIIMAADAIATEKMANRPDFSADRLVAQHAEMLMGLAHIEIDKARAIK